MPLTDNQIRDILSTHFKTVGVEIAPAIKLELDDALPEPCVYGCSTCTPDSLNTKHLTFFKRNYCGATATDSPKFALDPFNILQLMLAYKEDVEQHGFTVSEKSPLMRLLFTLGAGCYGSIDQGKLASALKALAGL